MSLPGNPPIQRLIIGGTDENHLLLNTNIDKQLFKAVKVTIVGEDGIVAKDDEDNEIGGYLPPCDEYVFETDVQFRHHLRIEHRHQDDGCPHHYVEQVFSDGLFAGHFHAVKIIKKVTRCSRVAFVKKAGNRTISDASLLEWIQ